VRDIYGNPTRSRGDMNFLGAYVNINFDKMTINIEHRMIKLIWDRNLCSLIGQNYTLGIRI